LIRPAVGSTVSTTWERVEDGVVLIVANAEQGAVLRLVLPLEDALTNLEVLAALLQRELVPILR
jgi:hypothetical protein